MKFLRWLKWQFYRLMGHGNCWDCGAFGPLSWFKMKFADKVAQTEIEYSGHYCSACWHKRMDPWKEKMDAFSRDFEKRFH
jgi:hypothetical protein